MGPRWDLRPAGGGCDLRAATCCCSLLRIAKISQKIRKIFAKFRNILPTFCRNFQTLRGPFSAVSRRLTKIKSNWGRPKTRSSRWCKAQQVEKNRQNFAIFRNFLQIFTQFRTFSVQISRISPGISQNARELLKIHEFSRFFRIFGESCAKKCAKLRKIEEKTFY